MPEIERRPSRSNTTSIVVGGIILVFLVAGGYFAWKMWSSTAVSPLPSEQAAVTTVADESSTYASSTLGLSLKYPKNYTVNEVYSNVSVNPKKPISGVKFTIPGDMATGTNLSADTGISIEWLPRAKACTGDIYLAANVKPVKLTEASTTYSVATSSEGAAGNMYEEMVFAIASSSPCTAVRYFIHSTNIGNYDPGTVRAFDRAALLRAFDKIRQSLVFN